MMGQLSGVQEHLLRLGGDAGLAGGREADRPQVPVCDKNERKDGTLSNKDFGWDGEANEYRYPEGKALRRNRRPFKRPRTHVTKAGTIIYRASAKDCADCPLKARCRPNAPMRKIARNVARRIAKTGGYRQSRKDRKKLEMLFAHLKPFQGFVKLRLRGFTGANDEFLLAAIAQNLRRMVKRLSGNAPEALPTPS